MPCAFVRTPAQGRAGQRELFSPLGVGAPCRAEELVRRAGWNPGESTWTWTLDLT